MSERIANIIVLSEDAEHQNLVRRYLQRVRHNDRCFRLAPLPGSRQCGSQYVRERFPEQVKECRGSLGRSASCLLIVITDADNLTVARREQTLHQKLEETGQVAIAPAEPIVLLIPKWQVETWIKCLLGETVSEDDPGTDRPPVTSEQIREAAGTVFDWARPNAQVGPTCVPSLAFALPRWRKIG